MSDPSFIELSDELRERLEKFREENAGAPLGPIADRVLFEDDKVRIWEMRLEPGEHSALHRHDHDYYLVMLQGDVIAGVPPKGDPTPLFAARLPPGGQTIRLAKGETEWAVNVGEKTFHEILVELKD